MVVVVEVAPEPPAEVAQAALDGCNGALGAGNCSLATAESGGEFYALVRSDPAQPGVFIVELRQRARTGQVLAVRELRFEERDTTLERSTSLGVVIAALVVAQGRRERAVVRAPPVPPPSTPVARAQKRSSPPRSRSSRRFRFDAGATLARVMEQEPLALGGLVRASMLFSPWPVFGSISGGYESGLTAEPKLAWFFGAAGLGTSVNVPRSPLALELRAEALVERVGVEARDPVGPATATAARWRAGGRLGLDGIWSLSESVGMVGGAQVSLLRPSLSIEVREQPVERAPALSGGVFLGLRYSP